VSGSPVLGPRWTLLLNINDSLHRMQVLHVLSNPIKPICLGYFSEILFVEEYNICASSCIFFFKLVLVYEMMIVLFRTKPTVSTCRLVATLKHIILLWANQLFTYSLMLCVNGERASTSFIVFGLIWSGIGPTIYSTRGKQACHWLTEAVFMIKMKLCEMSAELSTISH